MKPSTIKRKIKDLKKTARRVKKTFDALSPKEQALVLSIISGK